MDATQIEQVIVNLAINARDAMPDGGSLTIETANVVLDKTYITSHLAVQPGEYVLLAVSDTGNGMSEEVQTHIFEPFFTTKAEGKGTGLGLATVFGIVKQNGGDIRVYSEEGIGTTFKLYLPHAGEAALPVSRPETETEFPTGNETILLVEDNAPVRKLFCKILKDLGYTLLEAENGQEALQAAAHYSGPIHLLLTDVIMPDMTGQVLAKTLPQTHSDMKILFMSGYTDEVVARHGVLDSGAAFVQKPLSAAKLARKVRTVLDN
jgi:CheY-like chemotaxis protein